jgi:hypothetical protein
VLEEVRKAGTARRLVDRTYLVAEIERHLGDPVLGDKDDIEAVG